MSTCCLGMKQGEGDCQRHDEVTELKIEVENWKNECEKMRSEISNLKNQLDRSTRENTDLHMELSLAKARASYKIDDQRNCGGSLIKVFTSQQLSDVVDECTRSWEPEIILHH